MSKTVKRLLTTTAFYAVMTTTVIMGAPQAVDMMLNNYKEIQIENALKSFSKDETSASRAMMKLKKHLIVNIKTPNSSGSGNHLSKNVILTAKHVAVGAVPGTFVKTSVNGKVEVKQVTGVVLHPTMDIALVLVGEPDIKEVTGSLGDFLLQFRAPVDEETVFRIGFSQAKAMNSSEGTYEADETPSEEILTRDLDIFKVAGAGGDSGSLIFSTEGFVVGMVNEGPSSDLIEAKDAIKAVGIDQIPDDERSLLQDDMKTMSQDKVMFGYGHNLAQGVYELISQLKTSGATVPQPQFNIMSLFG